MSDKKLTQSEMDSKLKVLLSKMLIKKQEDKKKEEQKEVDKTKPI